MPAFEWSVAYTLVTPGGTLTFNPTSGDGYYLENVTTSRDIRRPVDPSPQRDGGIIHRGYKGPSYVTMRGRVQAEAGITTRRTSIDTLRGYVDTLLRPTASQLVSSCRLKWQPSGYGDLRMYDKVYLLAPVVIEDHPSLGPLWKQFTFTLVCEQPYAMDLTQTSTTIAVAGSQVLTNAGNSLFFPVVRVDGPATGFVLTNTSLTGVLPIDMTGLTTLTVGHYAEIDMLRETIYLDGDQANLLGKLTIASSDFWYLTPGANTVSFTATGSSGATQARVLWQHAWV